MTRSADAIVSTGRVRHGLARPIAAPRPALVEAGRDGVPWSVNRLPVAVVREEWRIVDRWWTEEPVCRRYFDVVLESGQHAVVYHDCERGGWFQHAAGSSAAGAPQPTTRLQV